MSERLLADWASNRGRPQLQIALVLFRLAQALRVRRVPVISQLAAGVYRGYSLCIIGMDIPVSTRIGAPLIVHHGIGLVIHSSSTLGSGITLRHSTTIGSKTGDDAPMIGSGVDIGPNSVIIGPVSVGSGARIGAGSVVLTDVAAGHVFAGNPARDIHKKA